MSSPIIIFRGAGIRYADLRHKEEAGVFLRLHMTADDTDTVRDQMDWEKMPDCVDQCKLSGVLLGKHFELIPNDKNLGQFGLQFSISEVSAFELVPIRNDDGDIVSRQLRFQIKSSETGAIAAVEEYLRRMGEARGQLKISHQKQEKLPLGQKPATEQNTMPIPTQPPAEERRTAEEIEGGVPSFVAKEPALASVGEMRRKGKRPN